MPFFLSPAASPLCSFLSFLAAPPRMQADLVPSPSSLPSPSSQRLPYRCCAPPPPPPPPPTHPPPTPHPLTPPPPPPPAETLQHALPRCLADVPHSRPSRQPGQPPRHGRVLPHARLPIGRTVLAFTLRSSLPPLQRSPARDERPRARSTLALPGSCQAAVPDAAGCRAAAWDAWRAAGPDCAAGVARSGRPAARSWAGQPAAAVGRAAVTAVAAWQSQPGQRSG
ncbi:hypothetical protein ABPG77_008694 [Micractinium sp. CCAP 211/92]